MKVTRKVKRVIPKIGAKQVTPIKIYVAVNNENYYLLEILDALKDFKSIPV
ncbi:MAG: hypothetical protein K9I99_02590 [Melioribacteraceae bacterium]|nr:hypothetical protein [Melioribacteraceae bacterium]